MVGKKICCAHLRLLSATCLVVWVLSSCGNREQQEAVEWKQIGLPVISGTVELTVAVVDNPRFRNLDDSRIAQLLSATAALVKQHFGLSITFAQPEHLSVSTYFGYLTPSVKNKRQREIIELDRIDDNYALMQKSLRETLENYSGNRQGVIEYARPYLASTLEADDFDALSLALVETLVRRLQHWQDQRADDGKPVLDGSPYNEWVWWDSIGYGGMPYDVVITNQLVASAETYAMDVHSAIRGGITAGTTSYSKQAHFGAYSWVTLYPLLNNSDLLVRLRGDDSYTTEQSIEYAAMMLTHELGHLLLHLGHPFGRPACVMSPMPLLQYRQWVEGIDAHACKVGSVEDMTPGIATIDYRTDL